MAPRAVIFDFNGTLSDDEPVLCRVFRELFAEHGRPLTERQYYDELAGHSDEEIVLRWLGRDHPAVEQVVAERISRYRSLVGDGSTIGEEARAVVRYAAERGPVAIVSGAARAEIEPVVEAAGLMPLFRTIVPADDVVHGKPDPEGYVRALEILDGGLDPDDVLVFEDTEAGVASAKAAGMRCVALTRTLGAARLAQADELVPELRLEDIRRLLG
ncbi:MAG TPA: HAD family phosphatase [Gaiellaceae bacterium]|nr:HAD family phosphatase [Gaiellaceae bacterium]